MCTSFVVMSHSVCCRAGWASPAIGHVVDDHAVIICLLAVMPNLPHAKLVTSASSLYGGKSGRRRHSGTWAVQYLLDDASPYRWMMNRLTLSRAHVINKKINSRLCRVAFLKPKPATRTERCPKTVTPEPEDWCRLSTTWSSRNLGNLMPNVGGKRKRLAPPRTTPSTPARPYGNHCSGSRDL